MIKKYLKIVLLEYYRLICKLRKPYEYIHILTHPRSGSTLLAHLLISNQEITGIGEAKLTYTETVDLQNLPIKVALVYRKFPLLGKEKYVLDKLVYNSFIKNRNVANIYNENTCIIFLLRDPKETLDSMSRLTWIKKKENPTSYIVELYLERIKTIRKYNQQLINSKCDRRAVLTYDQILNQTRKSFDVIEALLQLKQPVSENYGVIPTTGRWSYGDSSKEIFSGTIVRNRSKKKKKILNFNHYMDEIYQTYHDCYNDLTRTCHSLES